MSKPKNWGLPEGSQLSPYLELCYLRISANVSYANASEDVALFTGVRVSQKTQQRLVHHQSFSEGIVPSSEPIHQVSLDGGQMRFTPQKGEPSQWKQYKAVRLDAAGVGRAWFHKHDVFRTICKSIAIALSIMLTVKLKRFVRLVLEQLNLGLNRLTDGFRSQERVGIPIMHLKC